MICEKIVLHEDRNVNLTTYLHERSADEPKQARPAMVVLPGGGYSACSDGEGEPVALAYLKEGFNCFVLRYTLRDKGGWPLPLNDYDEVFELIERNAKEWNVDTNRVCVVGFSAGGHLAACTATLAKHKPSVAVTVYPAILPEVLALCQPGLPAPSEHVDRNTSPCFVVAARDDGLVPIQNALAFEKALADNAIQFESHIYPQGGHGFSVGTQDIYGGAVCERLPRWVADSVGFIRDMQGRQTVAGWTEPTLTPRLNDNEADTLSVDCTLCYLRQFPEAETIIQPVVSGIQLIDDNMGAQSHILLAAFAAYTLRKVMAFLQQPEEAAEKMDAALRTIPNRLIRK